MLVSFVRKFFRPLIRHHRVKKYLKFYINMLERTLNNIVLIMLEWKVAFRFLWRSNAKQHRLPSALIVSLTSYPPRFNTLPLTLKCLLSQTMSADNVILWIANQDKDALTPEILELQKYGLSIKYCDNLRSFKKIIPTLQNYPESFIVTADDDLYYWPTWLEELVIASSNHPADVICHRMHRIKINQDGLPLPYHDWAMEVQSLEVSPLNFQTGMGGVLYPPHVFHTDVIKIDLFKKLCPNADDIWLYWMMRLNGAVARKAKVKRYMYCWRNTQDFALCKVNVSGGGNDKHIFDMIHAYGMPSPIATRVA